MTATVFGATGLIGTTIIHLLINDKRFTKIKAVVRTKGNFTDAKVEEFSVDFEHLDNNANNLNASVFFSCLGTTIKKAGTQAAQLIIDRDYPIKIASLAKQLGVEKVITVSSIGADSDSKNFYLRTKGEMEKGVIIYMAEKAIFVRPSIIVGPRKEKRIGEKIGIVVMSLISPLFIGSLSNYKPISCDTIAKAMIDACFVPAKQFLLFDDMKKFIA